MKKLKIDEEFKSLIPPLTEEEYNLLEKSILSDGLIEGIVIWGETIVDGHNRYEICTKNDVLMHTRVKVFQSRNEAKIWIIDNQKGRRNLTMQQKLEIGFKRAELLKPKAEENQKAGLKRGNEFPVSQKSDKREPIDTLNEAAAYAGVSRDTASKYKKIQESDNEEVKEKVRTGELSINKGYKEVKPRKEPEKEEEVVEDTFSITENMLEDESPSKGQLLAEDIISELTVKINSLPNYSDIKDTLNILCEKLNEWNRQIAGGK